MANVRFFRITTLPQYNPSWRGSFLYLNQVYPADSLIIGYPLIFEFGSSDYTHNSNVVVDNVDTRIPIQSIWGSGGFREPAQNVATVDGQRYFCYFDSLNQIGYICWGDSDSNSNNRLYTISGKIQPGLWFGGKNKWELLTNEQGGLTLQDVITWINGHLDADTFQTVTPTTNADGSTTLTFNGIYEQDGIIYQGGGSDTVTISDGALSISGKGATDTSGQTPTLPAATTNDVHSANDTTGSTLTLNDSLVWTPSGNAAPYGGTIGVRVNTTVTAENPVATMADVAAISGAMHLIGSVTQESQLPTPTNTSTSPASSWNDGDTWIMRGNRFETVGGVVSGWSSGIVFEPGDTIVYLGNSFIHIQGNLTMGVEPGFVPQVSSDQNAPQEGLALTDNETKKLVATDGTGLIKTSIDPDNILSGAFERTQSVSPTTPDSAGIRHSILSTDTISIGSTDKERHLVVASTNTSILIDGSYNGDNSQTNINVDLVWRESISTN